MPKMTWGDFEVDTDRVLGRGGMGVVYHGKQISLERPVAIKALSKDLTRNVDFIQRFKREAKVLARLVHPHVVQVFGAGDTEEHYYFAMEFVDGKDLGVLLQDSSRKVFTLDEILKIGAQVGSALGAAENLGIIHRDIKPSNILMLEDGTVKVMDFGLAKSADTNLTKTSMVMGTINYLSPEQGVGDECDTRSDLYSLGVVLYHLSTNQLPFTGENPTSIIYQHIHTPPRPPKEINPDLSPGLEAIILRLMEKKPENRYQTAEEFLSSLRSLYERTIVTEEKATGADQSFYTTMQVLEDTIRPVPKKKNSKGLLEVLVLLILLAAGGFAGWKAIEGNFEPENVIGKVPKPQKQPPIEDKQPPIEEKKPPIEEKQPPIEEKQPPIEEKQPPIEEKQPPIEEKQPPIEEKQPPIEEKQPPIEEKQPPIEEKQPPIEEKQPPIEEKKPPIEEKKPPIEEKKPPIEEKQPPIEENKPPIEEKKPPIEEKQPPIEENKPPIEENKPPIDTRPGWLQTNSVFSSRNILFILDASGTMEKESKGTSRFNMVTSTLGQFLKNIRGNIYAALRVYGHQFRANDSEANKDSELVFSFQKNDPESFISSMSKLRPKGKSPTTYSLKEASQDLKRASSSPTIVILITDGRDSDRTAKPEEAAANLVKRGRGTHLHIIGVQMDDPWWGRQMEKAAKAGNGFFYDTQTGEEFKKALESTVGTAVFVLKSTTNGTEVQGKVGDRKELPPGEYTLIVPGQKTRTISIPSHDTLNLDITISSFRRRS